MSHDVPQGDILRGIARIAPFVRELLDEPDLPNSKIYDWLSRKKIPGGKVGGDVVASKTALRQHYMQAAAGLSPK
jgi:hypothetical protein